MDETLTLPPTEVPTRALGERFTASVGGFGRRRIAPNGDLLNGTEIALRGGLKK